VYNIVVVYSSCTSLPANTSSHSIPLESLPLTGLGATATRSVYSKVDNGRIPLTSPENHIKKCRMTVGMMCMNHTIVVGEIQKILTFITHAGSWERGAPKFSGYILSGLLKSLMQFLGDEV